MKENLSRKCLTTFIVFLFIGTSFVSVSGNLFYNYENKTIIYFFISEVKQKKHVLEGCIAYCLIEGINGR